MSRMLLPLLACLLACASPPLAAAVPEAEFEALKASVAALGQRVAELEQALAAERARNAGLPGEPAAATTAGAAPVPQPAPAWTERMSLHGDLRLRYEKINREGEPGRSRERIRARAALAVDPQPGLRLGVGLSTRQDGNPASSNQTLGNGASGKDVYLDLAWVDWTARPGLHLLAGKFRNNQYRPGGHGLLWDGDLNPEGLALSYDNGRFFTHLLGSWLESDTASGKAFGAGGQLGLRWPLDGDLRLTVGMGYFDLDTAGKGAFFVPRGKPPAYYGNSVDAAGRYLHDYRTIEGFANLEFRLAELPASLFLDHVRNLDADRLDTGWAVGARLGAIVARHDWELAWAWQKLDRDAVFGLWTDSSFAGGSTDNRGHLVSGTWAAGEHARLGISYFATRGGRSRGTALDDDRLQLDLGFRY